MEVVEVLKRKGFRLGGSRRMAEKFPEKIRLKPQTDWDLYGEDSEENRAFLASLGFALVDAPNRDYWDNLLVDMYQHPDHDVQVLLRSDVECYSAAFESIDAETFINRLWNSRRSGIVGYRSNTSRPSYATISTDCSMSLG